MLFFSFEFMYLFFPLVAAIFFLLGKLRPQNPEIGVIWLVAASLFFYGWWNYTYIALIGISILFNYLIGLRLRKTQSKPLLIVAITANLLLIGYFKYAGLFAETVEVLTGLEVNIEEIVLPLAISFYTFQQIAWLADNYTRQLLSRDKGFFNYSLFVMFFPQLIAGPIVHHSEMMPQFEDRNQRKFQINNFSIGLVIFVIGLTKKVVIADSAAPIGNTVFDAAAAGEAIGFIQAWTGALAYTVQLYFDFSGYADMAIGLAAMMNIRLPLNFNSPYKATSITDFWRRWHMTLSRFLRDYVYIPLGGNRKGRYRRYSNLIITMLIGGLWHGASWTFVFWGGLHGFYLVVNRLWSAYAPIRIPTGMARALTFVCVVIGWVFFRATSFEAAWVMIEGMFNFNDVLLSIANIAEEITSAWQIVLPALLIAWFFPNTQNIIRQQYKAIDIYDDEYTGNHLERVLSHHLHFKYNITWLLYLAGIASLSIVFLLDNAKIQEFIYFQF